jgi:hypothetical protein
MTPVLAKIVDNHWKTFWPASIYRKTSHWINNFIFHCLLRVGYSGRRAMTFSNSHKRLIGSEKFQQNDMIFDRKLSNWTNTTSAGLNDYHLVAPIYVSIYGDICVHYLLSFSRGSRFGGCRYIFRLLAEGAIQLGEEQFWHLVSWWADSMQLSKDS